MSKFLDQNGVLYLWGKIKAILPKKTSELTNDSGFITADEVPETVFPSSTAPKMNGTASVGTETTFARGDHVHPHDDTKVDKVTGKGLSTEDFTTAEKNKLASIADSANNYTLPEATASVLGGVKLGTNITVSSGKIGVNDGSTTVKGVVQMSDAVNANDSTKAATSKAVKSAYDLAASKQSPATSLSGYGITDAYTKTEIDSKLTSAMKYMGQVNTYADLPTTGNEIGHMYNVTTADATHDVCAGDNLVWNGTGWDNQHGTIDLTSYVLKTDVVTNADIDSICV